MATLAPTTDLEAINVLLASIGEPPINTLTGALKVDASMALNTLAEVSREVQSRGWYWNTEDFTLSPDSSGYITLPDNALRVIPIDNNARLEYIARGGRLYNKTKGKNTYVFASNIDVEIVLYLDFTDLPEAARRYITVRAGRLFQDRQISAAIIDKFETHDEQISHALLRQHETDVARFNVGTGSVSMQRIVNRYAVWR